MQAVEVGEPEYELIRPLGDNLFELYMRGWHPAEGPRVLVQVEHRGGRAHITGLALLGPTVGSTTLRSIPLAQIESRLNHPDVLEFQEPSKAQPVTKALGPLLKRTALGVQRIPRPQRGRLARPDGSDPDTFYKLVADAYNEAILNTSSPAPLLAEEAGVPVPTVHRWIAEARRRGFLPPARQGRAG